MEFVGAVSRASEHPETFHLPDTSTLEVDDVVKICNGRERFWVALTSVEGEKLSGRVDNSLIFKAEYVLGDVVNFERRNVYEVCRHEEFYPARDLYLPEELYMRLLEVEHCARRHKITGPLAHIARTMLGLWRDDMRAAMHYARMALTGPMPEPVAEACWRLKCLLEYMTSHHGLYKLCQW